MSDYKTPGVYIKEVSLLPPSVAQVETAIPAFIGNTSQAQRRIAGDLHLKPTRISSLVDYERYFGGPQAQAFTVAIDADDNASFSVVPPDSPTFRMYYALRMYFMNGGGPCYIVSVGLYADGLVLDDTNGGGDPIGLSNGLAQLAKADEPTIIYFPDAPDLGNTDYGTIYNSALLQCETLKDRVLICDVKLGNTANLENAVNGATGFRSLVGNDNLKYGACYYPNLRTGLAFQYEEDAVNVAIDGDPNVTLDTLPGGENDKYYHIAKEAIARHRMILPPGGAIAGVYARVDSSRGVWKAPANVSLIGVQEPTVAIDQDMNDNLNVDTTGKSVNAIRAFTGKGILVWGARTLAGNDNEWRYISVRRFYNMVEESVKKASEQFVFEPNDANTWVKVRAMIENFLALQWRAGALAGATTDQAFFVKVGLGQTMTSIDILEGRMIVEIGMAVVRPAEFIILKFSHKMQES